MINKYKNAHLWLLIPCILVLLGFAPTYWFRFPDAPWRHHIHGLTATLWFILLLVQPYLITRGRTQQHRWFGMIALIAAGAVVASALNVIPYNFENDRLPDVARYGLSFMDMVLISGFAIAVLMALKKAKHVDDHAKWMISTVFWAVSPGLFRLLFVPLIVMQVSDLGDKSPNLLATAGVINLLVLSLLIFQDRRFHPAYVFAAIGSLVLFFPLQVGAMQWWRNIADAVFTI